MLNQFTRYEYCERTEYRDLPEHIREWCIDASAVYLHEETGFFFEEYRPFRLLDQNLFEYVVTFENIDRTFSTPEEAAEWLASITDNFKMYSF